MEISQSSFCLLSGEGAGVGKRGGRLVSGTSSVSGIKVCRGGGRGRDSYLPSRSQSPPEKTDNWVRVWGSPNPDTHTSPLPATLYVPEKSG